MSFDSKQLDLSQAVIVSPRRGSAPEHKAVAVLIEEIAERTGITLKHVHAWPRESIQAPILVVGADALLPELIVGQVVVSEALTVLEKLELPGAEGYRIVAEAGAPFIICVVGADARGVLFGVGKLLRLLHLDPGRIRLDAEIRLSSTPAYPLRGHQLGYRPKTNAYDAWSREQFDRYIRELALFGANSIEILPPRTDDEAVSVHMKVPALDMMRSLSETIDDYGLDVWIWYPNMADNYDDPETVRQELAEREHIFRLLPRIDHVFIPGGDPGDVEPGALFRWAERVAAVLRQFHPQAKVWVSPQCFKPTREWVEAFYTCVDECAQREEDWLGGIVHGPWERHSLPELRERIPGSYPIRSYPDITHNYSCQFPVPHWDLAFAITQGRESINPRPQAMKHIHNMLAPHTIGSLSYSEGIYDDVNKFVWSGQDWDPGTPVAETLRDYARLLIGDELAEKLALAILNLEENWKGPLMVNERVELTLRQWQAIEAKADERLQANYRFQLGLIRAYYDAFLKRRLIRETELEQQALEALENAAAHGSLAALEEAERILRQAFAAPAGADLRRKCGELAERLFHSIGAQSTVRDYHAQSWERGAFMEHIDVPLNNSRWLLHQCAEVRKLPEESARLAGIRRMLERTYPGPGGFYDNLGASASLRRIRTTHTWEQDPEYFHSPLIGFMSRALLHADGPRQQEAEAAPLAWLSQAATHYSEPLVLTYDGLDPTALYAIKATYIGYTWGVWPASFRLTANGRYLIHGDLDVEGQIVQGEYSLPPETTAGGTLELAWSSQDGDIGPIVAEVWLLNKGREESVQA